MKMKKTLIYGVVALASAMGLTGCSDWTDPKACDLRYDDITEVNPGAYARYLAGLRAYRANDHKRVYAWFDNKASFTSQADHVAIVPDSIDVLVLNHPEALSQGTLDEINRKRSDTGMQTAYVVSYAAIRRAFDTKKELGTYAGEWSTFMADSLQIALSYFQGGGFDRLICSYDGRDMTAYPEADRAAYAADQKAFLGAFSTWCDNNIDKGFDFYGIPANLTDASALLSRAGMIFLSETATATNADEFSAILARNAVSGIPSSRFGIVAQLPVLDPTQADLGYWGSDYSSWVAARRCRVLPVGALGLLNLSDDYYQPAFIYPVCRGAIQILNPAAK